MHEAIKRINKNCQEAHLDIFAWDPLWQIRINFSGAWNVALWYTGLSEFCTLIGMCSFLYNTSILCHYCIWLCLAHSRSIHVQANVSLLTARLFLSCPGYSYMSILEFLPKLCPHPCSLSLLGHIHASPSRSKSLGLAPPNTCDIHVVWQCSEHA